MADRAALTVHATDDLEEIVDLTGIGWGVLAYVTRDGRSYALLTRDRKRCRTGACDWLSRAICICAPTQRS
jgi:hypothetical protein